MQMGNPPSHKKTPVITVNSNMSQPFHNSSPSFHGATIGKEERLDLSLRGRERKTIHRKENNPQQAANAEPRFLGM
jgi:hypothetical protein